MANVKFNFNVDLEFELNDATRNLVKNLSPKMLNLWIASQLQTSLTAGCYEQDVPSWQKCEVTNSQIIKG